MYWQREYVREGISMTLNSTYKLELPKQGLLGSMLLRLSGGQVSGLGQSGGSWRIIDYISKIEVVGNSSVIIKSLTGKLAQAIGVLDDRVMPPSVWRNYASNTQFEYIKINFGRWFWDWAAGLDLSRFDTVELWVTNTATSSQFSDLTISVVDYYLRDALAGGFPLGYIRSEVWREWTTVADETKYHDLPNEHPIRRIILQCIPSLDANNVEQTNMANLADDVELSFKTGQVRVFKGGIDDLMRENYYSGRGVLIATGSEYMNADKGVDISLGYVLGGAWGAGSQDGAGAATIATMETGRTSFTQKPETYEGDSPIGFLFVGIAPYLVAYWDFSDNPDPLAWLEPEGQKTVQLNVHTRNASSAASGTNRIALERLVQ